MTNNQFRRIRLHLKLSQKTMGNWINPEVKDMGRLIRSWESGERKVPGYIAVLMGIFDSGIKPDHIL